MNRNIRRMGGPRNTSVFVLIAIVVAIAMGGVVMLLWNAVLPSIVPVGRIDYWHATGLFVLCRILFGNLRPGSGRWRSGGPSWRQKWAGMNEEERLRFREEWKKRCAARKGEA